MKKNILLLLFLFFVCCITSMGDNLQQELENYRVPCYNTKEEYESLVGKTITYLPVENKRNSLIIKMYGSIEEDFKVLKIDYKWELNKKGRCDWTIKDLKTGNLHKLVVYYGDKMALFRKTDIGEGEDEVRNFDLPFFINMDEFKRKYLEIKFEHPLVKAKYEVKDVKIQLDKNRELCVYADLCNSIDGTHYYRKFSEISKLADDCFSKMIECTYQTTLVKVEKPLKSETRYGQIRKITDSITKYSYEDNFIDIVFYGLSDRLSFRLENKSKYSLKLLWNEAVFVDYSGTVSKITHKGIPFTEMEASQPSSTILRGAVLDDVAIPTRNIEYDKLLKDWHVSSMYPDIQINESKQVKLMLPIQIKDVVNEYVFVFEIKRVFAHPELLRFTHE